MKLEIDKELLEQKTILEKAVMMAVQNFENNTGLIVEKLQTIRIDTGYGNKKIFAGIEATIIL